MKLAPLRNTSGFKLEQSQINPKTIGDITSHTQLKNPTKELTVKPLSHKSIKLDEDLFNQ